MPRRLYNTSASQIAEHERCERRWWFKNISDLPKPEADPSQIRGKKIHADCQNTALTGKIPIIETPPYKKKSKKYKRNAGDVDLIPDPYVKVLMPWIPTPEQIARKEAAVEHPILLDTGLDLKWKGFVDAAWAFGRLGRQDPVEINDYKSVADRRYIKVPGDLLEDIQVNSYAEWAFRDAVPHHEFVRIGLIYVVVPKEQTQQVLFGRKPPKIFPVYADLTYDNVKRVWDRAIVRVERTIQQAREEDFHAIPPNPNACGDFGGCNYRLQCGVSAFHGIEQTNTNKESSVMTANFLQQLAAAGIPATNGHAGVPVAPQPTAAVPSFMQQMQGPAAAPAPAQPPAPSFLQAAQAPPAAPAPPPPPAPPAPPPAPVQSSAMPWLNQPAPAPQQAAPAIVGAVLPPDAPNRFSQPEVPAAPVQEEEKKKRGRPAGAKNKTTTAPTMATAESGLVLYVGCMPTKSPDVAFLEDWIQPVLELIRKERQVVDHRLLPYGEEKACLRAAIIAHVNANGIPESLVLPNGPLGKDVLETLAPFAIQVVRSMV